MSYQAEPKGEGQVLKEEGETPNVQGQKTRTSRPRRKGGLRCVSIKIVAYH